VVVTQIEPDGSATVLDAEGRTRAIQLSGKQYLDYAWVSTTYSSQGKTANRVLALLGNTTHREAFYVAISRAKHELTLYTAGREELMRLAQVSRAKENVSDYVPLFEQVTNHDHHDNTPNPFPGLTLEHWEAVLETALLNSLQPLQAEIRVNTQRVLHLEQDVQDLSEDLATLPQHLSSSLSHFLVQLQSIVTSENSSDARETLQEQLRQLIAALSSWNNQLKTELDLQQQLITSLKHLDDKIDRP
jgi:hypothetical protein